MGDSAADYSFLITQGARDDLIYCKQQDPWAASRISAFLRELASRNVYPEWLVDPNYSSEAVDDVQELFSFRAVKINAYRVKFVEIRSWRLIVAVDHPTRRVALMAVMPRKDDYENNTALWAAIEQEYDYHGFTRI